MNNPTRKNASAPSGSRDAFHDFPLPAADACVKCGLCLPHCPTYALERHEGDSPRGRIALMQGLAQQALNPEGATAAHLDGCLVCRACERVCPAEVPYGDLIDAGRKGLWRAGHRPGRLWRALAYWRHSPRRLAWLTHFLRLLHASRLAALLARLPLGALARASGFVREGSRPPQPGTHAPAIAARGNVSLFLGCIARPLDAPVAHATLQVLNAMGYAVIVPADQTCCGAMDAHAGNADTARRLAQANIAAFDASLDAVLTTASGCGIQLQEYARAGGGEARAKAFSDSVHDVMHFVSANRRHLPPLKHRPARVLVHAPCSLRNGMREAGALEVLGGVEGIETVPFAYDHCCGAAGSYLFEHAETADRLGNRLVDAFADAPPDVFVTSNIGCALHVERLLRERGMRTQVRHPIEMVAASLPAA